MPFEVISVSVVDLPKLDLLEFVDEAHALQKVIRFTRDPSKTIYSLEFLASSQEYVVDVVGNSMRLSLENARGIASYAKINMLEYTLIEIFVGILFSRLAETSPLFVREDFFHKSFPPCVLSDAGALSSAAQTLESLFLCPECRRFFPALKAENEIVLLGELLGHIEDNRISRSIRRRRTSATRNSTEQEKEIKPH